MRVTAAALVVVIEPKSLSAAMLRLAPLIVVDPV